MNDSLSRLYHVDEQREKKNHVSEIKVAIFQTMSRVFVSDCSLLFKKCLTALQGVTTNSWDWV